MSLPLIVLSVSCVARAAAAAVIPFDSSPPLMDDGSDAPADDDPSPPAPEEQLPPPTSNPADNPTAEAPEEAAAAEPPATTPTPAPERGQDLPQPIQHAQPQPGHHSPPPNPSRGRLFPLTPFQSDTTNVAQVSSSPSFSVAHVSTSTVEVSPSLFASSTPIFPAVDMAPTGSSASVAVTSNPEVHQQDAMANLNDSSTNALARNIILAIISAIVLIGLLACFRDKFHKFPDIIPCVRRRRHQREIEAARAWTSTVYTNSPALSSDATVVEKASPLVPASPYITQDGPPTRHRTRKGRSVAHRRDQSSADWRVSIITTSTNEYTTPISLSPPVPPPMPHTDIQWGSAKSELPYAPPVASLGGRSTETLPTYYNPSDLSRPQFSLPPPPPGPPPPIPGEIYYRHQFSTIPPTPLSPRQRQVSRGPRPQLQQIEQREWRTHRQTYVMPSRALWNERTDSTESLACNVSHSGFPLPPAHRDNRAGGYAQKPRPELIANNC
ncbi:hypothetical protein BKA62DRAFT_708081 [Auriculariales sp. MPI-PUGE-AT-0066]|nr:hypothetical protein BKA62DRAFT_708081 [Auriculariales sp. MPI-PUGE-AT-0066]